MESRIAANVLSQLRHGLVRRHHRIERVDALLRADGRVHGPAVVLDIDMRDAEHRRIGEVHGHRVRHHRDIDVVERALVRHDHLAALRLLGRRTKDDDARIAGLDRLDQANRRADA